MSAFHILAGGSGAVLSLALDSDGGELAARLADECANRVLSMRRDDPQAHAAALATARGAQRQAVNLLLKLYEGEARLAGALAPGHERFMQAASGALPIETQSADLDRPSTANDGDTARTSGADAVETAFAEFDVSLGPILAPEPFRRLFLGMETDAPGWFEAFAVYLAWEFKTNEAFSAAILQTGFDCLHAAGLETETALEALYGAATALAERFDAIRNAHARGEAQFPELFAERAARDFDAALTNAANIAGAPHAALASAAQGRRLASAGPLPALASETTALLARLAQPGQFPFQARSLIARAAQSAAGGDFQTAAACLEQAEYLTPEGGLICELQMRRAEILALQGAALKAAGAFRAAAKSAVDERQRLQALARSAECAALHAFESGQPGEIRTAAAICRTVLDKLEAGAPNPVGDLAALRVSLWLVDLASGDADSRFLHEAVERWRQAAQRGGADRSAAQRADDLRRIGDGWARGAASGDASLFSQALAAYDAAFAWAWEGGSPTAPVLAKIAGIKLAMLEARLDGVSQADVSHAYEAALAHGLEREDKAAARAAHEWLGDAALAAAEAADPAASSHQAMRAAAAFKRALALLDDGSASVERGGLSAKLAQAVWRLAGAAENQPLLEAAAAAFEAAVAAAPGDAPAANIANLHLERGRALLKLARTTGSIERFDEAAAAGEQAALLLAAAVDRRQWGHALKLQGDALMALGRRTRDDRYFELATGVFVGMIEDAGLGAAPALLCAAWRGYGDALKELGLRRGEAEMLGEAVSAHERALTLAQSSNLAGQADASQKALTASRTALSQFSGPQGEIIAFPLKRA